MKRSRTPWRSGSGRPAHERDDRRWARALGGQQQQLALAPTGVGDDQRPQLVHPADPRRRAGALYRALQVPDLARPDRHGLGRSSRSRADAVNRVLGGRTGWTRDRTIGAITSPLAACVSTYLRTPPALHPRSPRSGSRVRRRQSSGPRFEPSRAGTSARLACHGLAGT